MTSATRELAIGVDVGGTWLRLIALQVPDGRVVRRVRVPSGLATGASRSGDLPRALRALWRAHGWSRPRVASLVVASRGVWTPAERRAVTTRLRGLAGAVVAISDVEAALLGALDPADGRPGLLLLAGTGSIALGRAPDGAWVRAGGLGPLLGDEGSAFWIGREWVRATATPARARLLARAPDAVARVAAHARGVVARARRGGRIERVIVRAAQEHLAALARDLAANLGPGPLEASWAGGLLGDAWFRAGVTRAIARGGTRLRWRPPASDAARAAAREALAIAAPERA